MKYFAIFFVVFIVAFFLSPLIEAIAARSRAPKGGRERFVLKSWDPRCWVGTHGGGYVSGNRDDCREVHLRCDSCNYGWSETRQRKSAWCSIHPCARCRGEGEDIPVWGTRD